VWPSAGASAITEPRTARDGVGHVVVLRRGGQSGKLVFGRIDAQGAARGPLSELAVDAGEVGVPAIATNPRGALIAFAARVNADAAWGIRHIFVPIGAEPGPEVAFVPPGGARGAAISPSIAGLPDGRWLMQWTAGTPGAFAVWVATLGVDRTPAPESVRASHEGANAGQGVIASIGREAVSFFLVKTSEGQELWATSLRCP
jgi:hypothetical protein